MRRKLLLVVGLLLVVLVGVVTIRFGVYLREKVNSGLVDRNQGEEPPVLIQNIGIDFDDFEFTESEVSFNRLFFDYGFEIPANELGPVKFNPQPTFILPLGSEVSSLIDGVVVGTPKLYSGDFSVMVAPELDSIWAYELEHVINVRVKVGDRVKAGQVVAEVSDFDSHNYAGLGLVEIGVLRGGNPPVHLCPFLYLDSFIEQEVESEILELYRSWEEFRGDEDVYDESAYVTPGCLTSEEIEG